jgi:hypothetical protein
MGRDIRSLSLPKGGLGVWSLGSGIWGLGLGVCGHTTKWLNIYRKMNTAKPQTSPKGLNMNKKHEMARPKKSLRNAP